MTEVIALVDYGSGNLHSAEKALARSAGELGARVELTADPEVVAAADRIVIPGVGAFGDCADGLRTVDGLVEALEMRVRREARPCLGICVGLQLFATRGLERGEHQGLDWTPGEVVALAPSDPTLKVPHMGWNRLALQSAHPVLSDLVDGDFMYFVHSYHFVTADPGHTLAVAEYGQQVTAIVGSETVIGSQFHPEKSQDAGRRFLSAFLRWRP